MSNEYDSYFRHLFQRVKVATKVPFREVRLNGWEPKMNDCHANVDYWIQHHPETKAVRGWLFWELDEVGQCLFMTHSVLDRNGNGCLSQTQFRRRRLRNLWGDSRGRIRRQRLRILRLEIELSHLLQISFRESATKPGLQIARQPLQ